MPVVRASVIDRRPWFAILASLAVLAVAIDRAAGLPLPEGGSRGPVPLAAVTGHLVVSELMTGGVSASDEFIELYNPTAATLPLEGLEVVYATASGATVTRKAAWSAGTPGVPAGAHLLIVNGAGVFASIGDASYASGLAATGGSVAMRIQGGTTAIDALGWGNATSTWLESRPAPAPAAGSSLERLPGGASGSGQDTDDNLVDFATPTVPDPQNSGSAPIPVATASPAPTATPGATSTPEPSATPTGEPTVAPTTAPTATPLTTPSPTPAPTATPTPTPAPTATPTLAISIAAARALADGSAVTVEGVALTASDFTDGGGYVADATGGIAVLLADGSFNRGELLRVTGTLDDRYAQRTIRASAGSVVVIGAGSEPLPADAETGSIGEGVEGALVELTGVISSAATALSAGIAWDLDDGSGPTRVLIGTSTGIDTTTWARGTGLTVIGVVGQRDSSGSETTGFRVQPRDPTDVLSVEPIATQTPTPTPTPAPTPTAAPTATVNPSARPTPSATPSAIQLLSIGEARKAATGTRVRIHGVVTAQSGLLEASSAVLQDSTAGILVRLGSDAGSLALGEYVEVQGTRSTKAGMLTLRVTQPALRLGRHADPDPLRKATGAMGEAEEARVVIARGVVSSAVSHPHGGSVSFAIDDGSGPLRVTISGRAGIATASVKRGAWLELRGVLAQQTTGKAPLAGYRLWPRVPADLRVISAPVAGSSSATSCCGGVSATKQRRVTDAPLADTALGNAIPGASFAPPTLGRAHPTSSPASVVTAGSPDVGSPNGQPQIAGLVISGMGLAVVAALAARFLRRRPEREPPSAEHASGDADDSSPQAGPHLSLLRADAGDAQEEQRILPPI